MATALSVLRNTDMYGAQYKANMLGLVHEGAVGSSGSRGRREYPAGSVAPIAPSRRPPRVGAWQEALTAVVAHPLEPDLSQSTE